MNKLIAPWQKIIRRTIRSILRIAANERMDFAQFDVCSAILFGKLDEAIVIHEKIWNL